MSGMSIPDVPLRETLHGKGLRMTPQRQIVLDAVTRLGHATPEAVCAEVAKTDPGVNPSTVYRTLDLFERLGVIRHAHLGSGAATYHRGDETAHLHLVCESCGRVTEADVTLADELAGSLERAHGFVPDVAHMAISGLCADCAAERAAEQTAAEA
jgi:Fur family ferric uptake transcriptional regulator